MTTTSVLLTVGTTWGAITEKHDKEKENMRAHNLAEIAARELRETPTTREQALRIMREWIQKNNDIRNVRQGNYLPSVIFYVIYNEKTQKNTLYSTYKYKALFYLCTIVCFSTYSYLLKAVQMT